MDTDTIPVSGVDELEKHLDQLMSDPTLPLENKLFDDVELQITGKQNILVVKNNIPLLTSLSFKKQTSYPSSHASFPRSPTY
jgi:hypothetical protein